MTIILFLLVVSLSIAASALIFFLWSLRSGQYDDLDGAANRVLFDDPPPRLSTRKPSNQYEAPYRLSRPMSRD